jgi:hypothetical protein
VKSDLSATGAIGRVLAAASAIPVTRGCNVSFPPGSASPQSG